MNGIVALPDIAIGQPGEQAVVMTPQCTITIYIDRDGDTRITATARGEQPIAAIAIVTEPPQAAGRAGTRKRS